MPRIKDKKIIKKIIPAVFLLVIFIAPVLLFAQGGFVPCGDLAKGQKECGYADLLILVNNIIKWMVMISVPVAAGVFAWAGFKLMTSGVVDQKTAAKKMMTSVLWGFVFVLSAWIIVSTIVNALLSKDFPKETIPVEIN